MADETKIAMKLEEEAKPIKKMCEKLMDAVNYELDKGVENIDTKELGEAIDMIKDLYEAKKEMYEACYYKQIMEAMEDHDFENEEEIMDEGRKGYRGRSRDSMGRFTSRGGRGRGKRGYEEPMMMYDSDWDEMERMRDMDRMSYNRMGYSGVSGIGYSQGGQTSGGQSSSGMSGSSSSMGSGQSSGSMGGNRSYSESRYDRAKRGYEETKAMHNSGSAEDKQITMKEAEKMINVIFDELEESLSDAPKEVKDMIKSKGMTKLQKIQ